MGSITWLTPVGAFGLIVAEDALDRFLVKWIEKRAGNRVFRALLRLALNPGRTLSNSSTGRVPWHRDGRPLSWALICRPECGCCRPTPSTCIEGCSWGCWAGRCTPAALVEICTNRPWRTDVA